MERFKMIGVSAIFLLCLLSGCFAFAQGGAAGSAPPTCPIQNSLPDHATCRDVLRVPSGPTVRTIFACQYGDNFIDPANSRRRVTCNAEGMTVDRHCQPYAVHNSNKCLVPHDAALQAVAYCVSCETSRGRPPRAPRGSRPR